MYVSCDVFTHYNYVRYISPTPYWRIHVCRRAATHSPDMAIYKCFCLGGFPYRPLKNLKISIFQKGLYDLGRPVLSPINKVPSDSCQTWKKAQTRRHCLLKSLRMVEISGLWTIIYSYLPYKM